VFGKIVNRLEFDLTTGELTRARTADSVLITADMARRARQPCHL
jgi:hypothetical protein